VVVAAVRDPSVVRWAGEVPADIEATYRSAAAISALSRRRELGALLAARGAIVVDDVPGRLGPALTDTYLSIKATGRL
jgi:hypothetical protein